MMRFDDHPYGPFLNALNTLLGRISLVIVATALGSMLGAMTAYGTWKAGLTGLVMMLPLSFGSFLWGDGLWVLPLILLFTIGFVVREWHLRYAVLCTGLMWLNIHHTVRWAEFDSPTAKQMKAMESEIISGLHELETQKAR